jgi:hypothetical protein
MLLRNLFESPNNEVAIIFGRFNPPHKGHRAAWEMASQSPVWFVGTNQSTVGPKDPLPFDVKVEAMKTIWPEVKGHIVAETSWLTLASEVYKKYPKATLLCLTDEDWVTKTIVQYNGKEGAHGFYNFKNIEQKPTPRLSSATALRDAVAKGDREAFSQAAGVDADTRVAGKSFFDLVAEYLMPYQNAAKKAPAKKKKEPEVTESGTKPGWMLKQDPKLAAKVKAKTDLAKKRQASYGNPDAGKKFNFKQDDWSADFERRMKKDVSEGSAHGYNVAKWYEKWNDQGKLTKWLKKEAGLPKDAPVYFDDADLVYDDKTIVRDALVDPKLKFIDLLDAVAQAGGGKTKQYSQGIYRENDVAEGGLLKSIKRGLKGWQGSSHLDDIQDYIRNASDKTLVRLYKNPGESPYKQTPRDIQIKLINRELKRRYGVKPGEQGVAEAGSNAMADTSKRLANKDDGKVAKLRAAGDKRREDQLKYRNISKRNESIDLKTSLQELSSDMLGKYKKAASADATKADKEGNFKRGDKRFSGIIKATKKQFDNDLKGKK